MSVRKNVGWLAGLIVFAIAAYPTNVNAGTCDVPDDFLECQDVCFTLASCVECCYGAGATRVSCAGICAKVGAFVGTHDAAQETTCGTASTSQGTVIGDLDEGASTFEWYITFGDNGPGADSDDGVLTGTETSSHFHGPAAPGATASAQVTTSAGSPKSGSTTLTSSQIADLKAGLWYHNIHSSVCTGGEIRAQLTSTPLLPTVSMFPHRLSQLILVFALGVALTLMIRRGSRA